MADESPHAHFAYEAGHYHCSCGHILDPDNDGPIRADDHRAIIDLKVAHFRHRLEAEPELLNNPER